MIYYILVFLISMVPLIELRGAIPYAVAFGLDMYISYPIAIIGNMLPVPIIFLFARKVLEWGVKLKGTKTVVLDGQTIEKKRAIVDTFRRFCVFCTEKGHKGGMKLKEKAGKGLYIALLLFVGIPLPGTGAWTGTLAASFLDMDFKKSTVAVMLGVLLAGVIMGVVSFAVKGVLT